MPSSPGATTPLLLHPGYHKTGTTWYQNAVFQPQFGFCPVMNHDEVFAGIVKPHGLAFDPEPVRALLAERRGRGGAGSVDVISSEMLTGNPFYGGRESDAYARRLKVIAPRARVLITIREQTRALTSVYMQYLLRAGTLPIDRFFADDPEINYHDLDPVCYEYHRLVGLYCELFGRENVLVIPQEALSRDPKKVVGDLAAFAGVSADFGVQDVPTDPIGESYPEALAPILRRINYFRSGPAGDGLDMKTVSRIAYRGLGTLGRSRPGKRMLRNVRPVTRRILRRFEGRYLESNRQLKALMGDRIDLSGYPM